MTATWVVTPERRAAGSGWRLAGGGADGVGGFFERMFAPRVLRRLNAEELEWLDRYDRTASPGSSSAGSYHGAIKWRDAISRLCKSDV